MKYNQCIEELTSLIGYKPACAEIARILSANPSAIVNRASRDGNIKDNEIDLIEHHYAVKINRDVDNFITLDYYPDVFGSCGNGAFVLSETKEQISVPRKSFLTRVMPNVSNVKKYSVINARGDSMQPYINEGDKLIVEHYEGGQINDNKVYVFCYENEIFVKRLVKNITQIVIKSDNPLYDPVKIDGKDANFVIIGQIVGMLRIL